MPIWGPVFGQISWDQYLGTERIYRLIKHLESLQQKQLPERVPFLPLSPMPEPSVVH